jgi:phosphatidylinositol kinase/protein kinase (PI-3  family)
VIRIQREQYGVTVHLFIGTGCSLDKITSMPLTFTLNHKVNYQGLSSLFPFRSVSSPTSIIILSRSSFNHSFSVRPFCLRVVPPYHTCFHQKENLHPKAEASCNSLCYTKNIWLVTFLRTFGKGRPQQTISCSAPEKNMPQARRSILILS